jgi:putative copper export protein
MKGNPLENYESWMRTGGVLCLVGVVFLVFGWLAPDTNKPPLGGRFPHDLQMALAGGICLLAIGSVIVACAGVGWLKNRPRS